MLDFGKLKNDCNCSCIFRNSIASHTKLCNFVDHFYNRLGKATVIMQAQMSKISGQDDVFVLYQDASLTTALGIGLGNTKYIQLRQWIRT